MKETLMLYYSLEGNTAYVAQLAERSGLGAERLRVEKEPPKKGLGKFLRGGKDALMKADPGLLPIQADPAGYENILLAFPVWAGTYPPAIGALLARCDFSGKRVYAIACSASGNTEKAFGALAEALGGPLAGSLSLVNPLKHEKETTEKLQAFLETLA